MIRSTKDIKTREDLPFLHENMIKLGQKDKAKYLPLLMGKMGRMLDQAFQSLIFRAEPHEHPGLFAALEDARKEEDRIYDEAEAKGEYILC